jgi:hypothetical protein
MITNKPIETMAMIFFDLMRNSQSRDKYSTSLWMATQIVKMDKLKREGNENTAESDKYLKRLKFIRDNTHEELKKHLADVETIVTTIPRELWADRYKGDDNKGNAIRIDNDKAVRVMDMDRLLKEAYEEMIDAVCYVIKDYSLEYRMNVGSLGVPEYLGGGRKEGE